MDAIHGPQAVGEAHAAEISNHFLWVDETDAAASLSSCGLAHTELVGEIVVNASCGVSQLHVGNGHKLL